MRTINTRSVVLSVALIAACSTMPAHASSQQIESRAWQSGAIAPAGLANPRFPDGPLSTHSSLRTLPPALARAARAELGKARGSAANLKFHPITGGYQSTDISGAVTATFTQAGTTLAYARKNNTWSIGMQLVSYGGQSTMLLNPKPPVLKGSNLRYGYPTLIHWYKNGVGGLEEGITLKTAPPVSSSGTVVFNLHISGLTAKATPGGQSVRFLRSGSQVLVYAGLGVRDANHHLVDAHFHTVPSTHTLQIVVKPGSATYPLTIDPYFSAQELINPNAGPDDWFGSTVAITPDGRTAVIGAMNYGEVEKDAGGNNNGIGAAYVFTRSRATYQETATLLPSDGASKDQFGEYVAISADGKTVLATANGHNEGTGAVYAFTDTGSGYTQTDEFTASDSATNTYFGSAVALSSDGTTAIVGALFRHNLSGAAYIFQGSAGVFTQTQELTDPTYPSGGYFGGSVAINADGSLAVIGAIGHNTFAGTAFVYHLDSGITTGSPIELSPSGQSGANVGEAVATDASGDTLLLGAEGAGGQGAAYLYSWNGSTYDEAATLTASDGVQGDQFGASLALSQDGNVALIGALYKPGIKCTNGQCQGNFGPGATYVFTRGDSGWDQTAGLAAYDGTDVSQFGNSVAITGDGSVALIGSETHNNAAGAAYVFGPTGAPATDSVKLTTGTNPSNYGDSLTFTAHVGPASDAPPTGNVEFWDGAPSNAGSIDLGGAPVIDSTASLTTTALHVANKRVYAIYGGSPSFAGSQNSVAQQVNPISATITADNQTGAIGSPVPDLTFTAQGLINGDTPAGFDTPPTCTTTAPVDNSGNLAGPAGAYPITCADALDPDYSFTYVDGTLTVQ